MAVKKSTTSTKAKSKVKKDKAESELRAKRSAWLLVFLLLPLGLAFMGFFKKQTLASPDWPDPVPTLVQRGIIRARNGTVFAEGQGGNRYYPQGNLAAHIIGFSGDDQGEGRFGLEGLEFTLDLRLKSGEVITITIDPRMQAIVQAKLRESIKKFGAENGSVVILEAGTGRILAAASYPEFDPNYYGRSSDYSNKAFRYLFEPGSVMKPFVVAAALQAGRATTDEILASPMNLKVGDQTFYDVAKHPLWLGLADVLRYSSNSGMIHLGQKFNNEELYAWLAHFGFGQHLLVPSIYTQTGILRDTPWVPQDHASITIGQSMATTSLQLATAYSIFANDGMLVTPYLIEGDEVAAPQQRLSPEVAAIIRSYLQRVVDRNESIAKVMVPGLAIGGKTGTADVYDAATGSYIEDDFNVTFAGMFPVDKPELTMVVTLQKPRESGSSTVVAAPLFGDIAREVAALYQLPVKPLTEVNRP